MSLVARARQLIYYLSTKEAYAVGVRKNEDAMFNWQKDIPFQVIRPTRKQWYADPFLFCYRGNMYLFVEIMDERYGKGTIGYCELEDNLKTREFKEIIREPFHMSYPYVFEFNGVVYMIPETFQANSIRLYKCVTFPNEWTFDRILVENVRCVDTSFIVDELLGLYAETHDIDSQKNRFYKMDLLNDCTIEITDQMTKRFMERRPGGGFLQFDNGIFHALQNCDNCYGEYLHICKVNRFDDQHIDEDEVCTISIGDVKVRDGRTYERVHTFNRCGDYEAIDLFFYQNVGVKVIANLFRYVKKKVMGC